MFDLRTSFPGQESNEVVFVFARPYFFAFLPNIVLFLIAYFFAFGVQYVVSNGVLFTIDPFYANLTVVFLGFFQLVALIVFFVSVFDFYYDIIIVTNQRVVDIDQEQLFSRPIAELSLMDVEDVRSDVTGVFQTILNYGDIEIQTAGTNANFVAENLRHPREVVAIVSDLAQQAKENVPDHIRRPRTHYIGLINNEPVSSLSELAALGAILPEEVSRLSAISENDPE